MAMTMHVDVVSVEESLFSGLAEYVIAPAEMGEVGIYPMHAPLLTRLKSGFIRLKIPFQVEETAIYVSSGILAVQSQGVTILSDIAIREQDIQEGMLAEKTRQAEATLRHPITDAEYTKLEIELAQSLMQLKGIARLRHGKKGY